MNNIKRFKILNEAVFMSYLSKLLRKDPQLKNIDVIVQFLSSLSKEDRKMAIDFIKKHKRINKLENINETLFDAPTQTPIGKAEDGLSKFYYVGLQSKGFTS